ncbi:MAG: hypothetical protein WC997_13100 [Porticoccaceae bacterium]
MIGAGQRQKIWALVIFAVIFMWSFLHYAWLTEDAFINFRVIENVREGYGLVWNQGERVQVYTSPLWMLITTIVSLMTGELFYTVIGLSLCLMTALLLVLYRLSNKNVLVFLPVAVLLLTSKSIRDYSTSGLETPLLALGVGLFAYVWCKKKGRKYHTFWFFLLASVCLLIRHDSIVLTLPFLVQHAFFSFRPLGSARLKAVLLQIFLAALPFVAWTVFSLVYYGIPVPNTARAKIVSGFDGVSQALHYFEFMQHFDPAVYVIAGITLLSAWILRDKCLIPLASVVGLFVVYMCYIGGDYMAGRFFVGPVILCGFLLAFMVSNFVGSQSAAIAPSSTIGRLQVLVLLVALLVYGTFGLTARNNTEFNYPRFVNGIVDERGFYYRSLDLGSLIFSDVGHPWRTQAEAANEEFKGRGGIVIVRNIGLFGLYVDNGVYIVDRFALSDPFLAAFPTCVGETRIGHFERSVPVDYIRSLQSGSNQFTQPVVRQYYDDVVLMTRGDIFSFERFRALLRINTGFYSKQIDSVDISELGGAYPLHGSQIFPEASCLGGNAKPVMVAIEE